MTEPTHVIYKGGTLDGVWRECMICRKSDGYYWMQTITVFKRGDGPIIARFAMSEQSFDMIAACMRDLSYNLGDYAIGEATGCPTE